MKQLNTLFSAFSAKPLMLLFLFALLPTMASAQSSNINFADEGVKAICVANWDSNKDQELSYDEAAAVTDLGDAFKYKGYGKVSFDEFQYFTSVKSIPTDCFMGWEFNSIKLPQSITSIEDAAFWHCSLKSISLPNSVAHIGNHAFDNCFRLTTVDCFGEAADGTEVSEAAICESAFYGCYSLISVTIPSSVKNIGGNAFNFCSMLSSVNIPNSVVSIGEGAFSGCTSLAEISIPNSVISIEGSVFYGCSLSHVVIPKSVTTISGNPFSNCTHLEQIEVEAGGSFVSIDNVLYTKDEKTLICYPAGKSQTSYNIRNNTEIIGNNAFQACSNLTSITIPNSVKTIGGSAFSGCTSLKSITWPNSLVFIGNSAFSGCPLTSVTIPQTVTHIGTAAFSYTALTTLTIPKSVVEIGDGSSDYIYSSCNPVSGSMNLEAIIVEEGNSVYTSENGVLFDKDMTTLIAYPAGKADNAYTIPNAVTTVLGGGFAYCVNLATVTIGSNMEILGPSAFIWCSGLRDIYCYVRPDETAPDDYRLGFGFCTNVFLLSTDWNNPIKLTLHVPAGCKQYYEQWSLWSEMTIVEMNLTPIDNGESVDIGNEIDANTNLDGNVVGDIYYCISSDSGSYDPEEGCLVVTKPTDDSAIDGKDIFGEDFKAGFDGLVFMVAPGKGTIKVETQTIGNMVLKVKVGDNAPAQKEVNGKTKVSFSYDVSEPTRVFIYGSSKSAGAKGMRKASSTDMLKIYGIEVTSETNGIKTIDNGQLIIDNSPVYNLNGQRIDGMPTKKGVFIKNGKKVLVK